VRRSIRRRRRRVGFSLGVLERVRERGHELGARGVEERVELGELTARLGLV